MYENPFKPTFGSEPLFLAGRERIIGDIIGGLGNQVGDPNRSTIFVGSRGSGKTVLLLCIAEEAKRIGWIPVMVTAHTGMLDSVLEQALLLAQNLLAPETKRRVAAIQAGGFGISLEAVKEKGASWRVQMSRLLEALNAQGVGLLICVDEVRADMDEMVTLVANYQHFVGEHREVALLMAGLPGKVMPMFQHETISFLRRAFQHRIGAVPLAEARMAMRKTIEASGRSIDDSLLHDAAMCSRGFPFLIQLVGYHIWRQSPNIQRISAVDVQAGVECAEVDMENMILENTIRELSARDLDFLIAMSPDQEYSQIGEIAKRAGMSQGMAGQYRIRLIQRGLIADKGRGKVGFELPFLQEYIVKHFS
ncbi:MAG: hypothetical protein LBD12_06290 [Clostridiales Family XIII bacterium]|jgi:hypothetical protein|nr:hypothetical protein [Clostridiales Family XIII bacterium]